MRVFLDTNVLVSAFAARGLCADLMRLLLAEHELLVGEVNLAELRRVLVDRFEVPRAQAAEIEALLREQTVVPKPERLPALKVRDAEDAWVLASALNAEADVLVTGDQDLLVQNGRVPLPVAAPRDAWELLRRG